MSCSIRLQPMLMNKFQAPVDLSPEYPEQVHPCEQNDCYLAAPDLYFSNVVEPGEQQCAR
jgi:hypothetical protein